MAKAPRIREGDIVTLKVNVLRVWEDGKITLDVAGQRVTMREDNPDIAGVERGRDVG